MRVFMCFLIPPYRHTLKEIKKTVPTLNNQTIQNVASLSKVTKFAGFFFAAALIGVAFTVVVDRSFTLITCRGLNRRGSRSFLKRAVLIYALGVPLLLFTWFKNKPLQAKGLGIIAGLVPAPVVCYFLLQKFEKRQMTLNQNQETFEQNKEQIHQPTQLIEQKSKQIEQQEETIDQQNQQIEQQNQQIEELTYQIQQQLVKSLSKAKKEKIKYGKKHLNKK